MPVIKDLVVDLDQFYRQYTIKPYSQAKPDNPKQEFIQSESDRKKIDNMSGILCLL